MEKLNFYNKSGRRYSSRITYMSVVLQEGLRKLGTMEKTDSDGIFRSRSSSRGRVMRLFSQDYLGDILDFCAEQDWIEREFKVNGKKTFDFKSKNYGFAGTLCIKGLKLVTNVVRMIPSGIKVDHDILEEIVAKLETIVNKRFLGMTEYTNGTKELSFQMKFNRHATYLIIKLLDTLVGKFPDIQNKITVKLLKCLSKQVKVFTKKQQHKNMLKIVIKLAGKLTEHKKSDLYRHILDIDRDFKASCYSNEIKTIVFDSPLTFTSQTMDFFKTMQPHQQVLNNLGKLLFEVTKTEVMAKRYYEKYLAQFFDTIFTSAYFYWSNLRFIIIFVANFKFVWKELKFNKGFIKSFLRAIHLNPHFLNLINQKVELFDEFLALHEIRYNPNFLKKLSKVKNEPEVIDRILEMRVQNIEQIGSFKVKRSFFVNQPAPEPVEE